MKLIFTLALAAAVTASAVAIAPRSLNNVQPKAPVLHSLTNGVKASAETLKPSMKRSRTVKANEGQRVKAYNSATNSLFSKIRKAPVAKDEEEGEDVAEDAVLFLDETFATLTEGTEEDPVAIETDDYSNIPVDIIGEDHYGWGGDGLAQAGGSLFCYFDDYEGMIWTPDIPTGYDYTLTFEVRTAAEPVEDDCLVVQISDYNGNDDGVIADFSTEWTEVELQFSVTNPSWSEDMYLMFYSYDSVEGADFMIRNVKLTGVKPAVATPLALDYTDLTYTSFTANWEAVEGADGYLFTLATLDTYYYEVIDVLMMEEPVEGTSYVVNITEPGVGYAYCVAAVKGDEVSGTSDMIMMVEMAPVTGVKAQLADEGLTAEWDENPNANYYSAQLYKKVTFTEDTLFALADGDFSSVEGSGSVEEPDEDELYYGDYEIMPGWYFQMCTYIDGAIGLVDDESFAGYFGMYASLQSALLDLSGAVDGKVSVAFDAASNNGQSMAVCLYNYVEGDTEEDSGYELVDYAITDYLTTEFQHVEVELSGATDKTIIYVMLYGNAEDELGVGFFKNFKAEATMKAGSSIVLEDLYDETEEATITFDAEVIDYSENVAYLIGIKEYYVDEYGDVALSSDEETIAKVENATGVENIAVDASQDAPVVFYNLQGIRVANPAVGGLYIRQEGSKTVKVIR